MSGLNDLTYVSQAEAVIKQLNKNNRGELKPATNKIRNMLTLINELYDKARYIREDKLNIDLQSHIQYVKMRLIYEAGRDAEVKNLLLKSKLIEYIDSIGNSKKELLKVCHYMESLVAYHRYYTEEK
jgi:CRISPR-associated protein Csm2